MAKKLGMELSGSVLKLLAALRSTREWPLSAVENMVVESAGVAANSATHTCSWVGRHNFARSALRSCHQMMVNPIVVKILVELTGHGSFPVDEAGTSALQVRWTEIVRSPSM